MVAKILAGVVASVLVAVTGVYVAFSGDTPRDQVGDTQSATGDTCCARQLQMACTDAPMIACEAVRTQPTPDALAACTGSAAFAVSTGDKAVGTCCQE